MEIRQLQYFVETCKCNNYTQAAENCYMTSQGIKMSISRLEDELGLKLLRKTPRGIFPTKDGEYLLPKAEEIIKIINECETHFSEEAEGRRTVSAMFVRGTVEKFAHNSISRLKEKYPNISVHIQVGIDSECEEAVHNGEADIALCAGPVSTQKFDATLLYKSKNVLVANKQHPLGQKKAVSIADIKNTPLALQKKTTRSTNTLFTLCRKEGFEPVVFAYVDDLRTAVYLADINESCGVMNLITAKKICTPNLSLIPFDCEEMDWNIYLIKNKDARLSPEARELERILLQNANTDD